MVAEKQGISAMPTFQFFKNRAKIDELRGADPAALEAKIKQHIGDALEEDDVGVPGHVSCSTFHFCILKNLHFIMGCRKQINS